jgi:hypothetical protein
MRQHKIPANDADASHGRNAEAMRAGEALKRDDIHDCHGAPGHLRRREPCGGLSRDTTENKGFTVYSPPSAAQHSTNPLGGTAHRRVPGRACLVFGERAIRRAKPQRERQGLAILPHLRAGVDVK